MIHAQFNLLKNPRSFAAIFSRVPVEQSSRRREEAGRPPRYLGGYRFSPGVVSAWPL